MPTRSDPGSVIDPSKVVNARIERVEGAVFLTLPGGEPARLEWDDSIAAQENQPFESLERYAPGKGQTLPVVVYRSRAEHGQLFYFVHERWTKRNPWVDIGDRLQSGDRVTGVVTSQRVPGLFGEGYLVQLDTSAPVCSADGLPMVWEDNSPVMQPDIRVLVRADELPSAKGSTAPMKSGEHGEPRLSLQEGDRVAALVREVLTPPRNSLASVLHVMHAQDVDQQRRQGRAHSKTIDATGSKNRSARRRIAQQLLDQWQVVHDHWGANLKGRRLVLIDDQKTAHTLLAPVLRSYGAHVLVHAPERDDDHWPAMRYVQSLEETLRQPFDLLLVDDGLPATHDGEDLLVQALQLTAKARALEEVDQTLDSASQNASPPLRRIVLMSANTTNSRRSQSLLRSLGIHSTVRRPLLVRHVSDFLEVEWVPEWQWRGEDSIGQAAESDVLRDPQSQPGLAELFDRGRRAMQQDYVVLLAITPDRRLRWIQAAGQSPVQSDRLDEIARNSSLREMVLGIVKEKVFAPGDSPHAVHPVASHKGEWRALGGENEGLATRFLLGTGSRQGRDAGAAWPWFAQAVAAELRAIEWKQLLEHHSTALASGWLSQGNAHEYGARQENVQSLVTELMSIVRRSASTGGVINADTLVTPLEQLRQHADAAIGLSQRLLKRQRDRATAVNLPAWADGLRSGLWAQCKEHDVALHFASVPDLTLSVPELVLTVALSNLVLNAVKHHYRQEARWVAVDISVSADATKLHIDVRDNGPGLSAYALQHLFEPGFSWAPQAEQRQGMGLWLSRLLTKQEGGALSLEENWRGVGARFRITLPTRVG